LQQSAREGGEKKDRGKERKGEEKASRFIAAPNLDLCATTERRE